MTWQLAFLTKYGTLDTGIYGIGHNVGPRSNALMITILLIAF